MPPVTIRDVARHAGVGVATVSRVLNDNQHVREDTRERVLDAIEQLNYVPNIAARQLSGGKTMTIGIATPYLTIPSFAERLAGIQQVLWNSRYDLTLHSVRTTSQLENKLRTLLEQNRVDGIMLLSPPPLGESLWETNPDMPVVVVDSHYPVGLFPTIAIDDERGGRIGTEFLIDHGHRHIGFVGDEIESTFGVTSNKYRYDGFLAALDAHDLPHNPDWCRFGAMDRTVAERHVREVLAQPNRPTALFVSSDIKAFVAMNVAREMGLEIPADIAIIGFDDIEAASFMGLTTVRQHLYDTGRQAAELLLGWLRSNEPPTPTIVYRSVDIVERRTV